MSPAFSSPKQAAGFALLLLVIVLLPVIAGKPLLPPREQMYSSVGRETIDYPSFHEGFFVEKGDIDVAIMSSSRLGVTIDAPYVEEKLGDKLGRRAVVRSYCWTWNGYDALYFIAKDLLEQRKVRMLVFTDLSRDATDIAHHQTSYWFRYADDADALAGLPLKSRISFYSSAVLGMPRNLAGLLRPNLASIPAVPGPGWNHSPLDFSPGTITGPRDVSLYSDATRANFHFATKPLPAMQLAFVRKIGVLARAHHTALVLLNVPDFEDRKQTLVEEAAFWPDAFQGALTVVGIPPAILYAGMTDEDVQKLYYNPTHFNQNGARYFTRLVTPALVGAYEDQVKH